MKVEQLFENLSEENKKKALNKMKCLKESEEVQDRESEVWDLYDELNRITGTDLFSEDIVKRCGAINNDDMEGVNLKKAKDMLQDDIRYYSNILKMIDEYNINQLRRKYRDDASLQNAIEDCIADKDYNCSFDDLDDDERSMISLDVQDVIDYMHKAGLNESVHSSKTFESVSEIKSDIRKRIQEKKSLKEYDTYYDSQDRERLNSSCVRKLKQLGDMIYDVQHFISSLKDENDYKTAPIELTTSLSNLQSDVHDLIWDYNQLERKFRSSLL